MTGQTIPADLIDRLAEAIARHTSRRIPPKLSGPRSGPPGAQSYAFADTRKMTMKIDTNKLVEVMKRTGGAVFRNYCEAAVTIGEVDGVVYRVVAMDAMSAEDKDCTEGPEWARCVTKA